MFFTNNDDPTIEVQVVTSGKVIEVYEARLNVNSKFYNYTIPDNIRFLSPVNSERVYKFKLSNFGLDRLNLDDSVRFELKIRDSNGKDISKNYITGNLDVQISFDNSIPEILSETTFSRSSSNLNYNLRFNKKIKNYTIFINNELYTVYSNPTRFYSDLEETFSLDFSDFKDNFLSEDNQIIIYAYDIYGNMGEFELNLIYQGDPLEIILLTKRDDDSLKYDYDINNKDFYQNKLFVSEEDFMLKLKTNKPAKCYYAFNLLHWTNIGDELLEKNEFTTTDNLFHNVNLNVNNNNRLWVACQSTKHTSEIGYLSSIMGLGNNLIDIEFYDETLEIIDYWPEGDVTTNNVDFWLRTSSRSICEIKNLNIIFESSDYLEHHVQRTIPDGSQNILFNCRDVVGNVAQKTSMINVDGSKAVRIVTHEPKFVSQTSTRVNVTFSESADCRYSKERISPQDFMNTQQLSGTGIFRYFMANNLNIGRNTFHISCSRGPSLMSYEIDVIYDNSQVILNNLRFVSERGVESIYVGSKEKLNYRVNVNSGLVAVEKFYVNLTGENKNINQILYNANGTISNNLSGINKITIVGENDYGVKSEPISRSVLFDLKKPEIDFYREDKNLRIICLDEDSGCDVGSILYGFSELHFDCEATNLYEVDSFLNVGSNKYVCVEAYDKVDNYVEEFRTISDIPDSSVVDSVDDPSPPSDPTPPSDPAPPWEPVEPIDPFDPWEDESWEEEISISRPSRNDSLATPFPPGSIPQQGSSSILLILIIILVILLAIGAGGYYAYNKGYLDYNLKKYGFAKYAKNKGFSNTFGNNTNINNFNSSNKPHYTPINKSGFNAKKNSSLSKNSSLNQSKYEKRMDKLNNFVDKKINSKTNIFDKFDDSGENLKGKVDGYEDTLIKKEKEKRNISEEEFDEFYKKSKNLSDTNSSLENVKTLEKEAESFEDFYREKKLKEDMGSDLDKNKKKNNEDKKDNKDRGENKENKK